MTCVPNQVHEGEGIDSHRSTTGYNCNSALQVEYGACAKRLEDLCWVSAAVRHSVSDMPRVEERADVF